MRNRSTPSKLAVCLLCVVGSDLRAQSMGGMVVTNVRHSLGDVWDVWTSPLRATAGDWLVAGSVVGASAIVSPLDDEVDRWAVHNHGAAVFKPLEPLREGGFIFSGRAIAPLAAGALVVGIVTKNQRIQEGLFGCLASYGASSVVRNYVVYPLIARTRPDTRQPGVVAPPARQGDQYHFAFPGSSEWGEHSIPGGHIANIFACSEFLTRRFSMGAAEPILWAIAGGVGVGRTLDRRHWFSDQILGALYGYAVGKEVAIRSSRRADKQENKRNKKADGRRSSSGLFLTPGPEGWRLGWQRSFH